MKHCVYEELIELS